MSTNALILPPPLDFRNITDQTHVDVIHARIAALRTMYGPFNSHVYVHPTVIAFESGREKESWRPDQMEPRKMGAMHEFVKAPKAPIRVVVCCTYAGNWVKDCVTMPDGSKRYNHNAWHVWGLALVKCHNFTTAFIYDDGAQDQIESNGCFQGAILPQQLRLLSKFAEFSYGPFKYQLAGDHHGHALACQRHTLEWIQRLMRHDLPNNRPADLGVGYCVGQLGGSVAPLNFHPININTKNPAKARAEAEARAANASKAELEPRRTRSSGLREQDKQVLAGGKGKRALSSTEAKRSVYDK